MWVSEIQQTFHHKSFHMKNLQMNLMFCSSDESGDERVYFFAHQHSVASEFIQALWFALIANTDVICYLFIFLNTTITMSIFTLPMSLCVCLWATLTLPRPTKRFWLTIIAYTEVKQHSQRHFKLLSP